MSECYGQIAGSEKLGYTSVLRGALQMLILSHASACFRLWWSAPSSPDCNPNSRPLQLVIFNKLALSRNEQINSRRAEWSQEFYFLVLDSKMRGPAKANRRGAQVDGSICARPALLPCEAWGVHLISTGKSTCHFSLHALFYEWIPCSALQLCLFPYKLCRTLARIFYLLLQRLVLGFYINNVCS